MITVRHSTTALTTLAFILAACGGSSGAPTGAASSAANSVPAPGAASAPGANAGGSEAPPPIPAASVSAGGGGAGGVCGLVTVAELQQIFGFSPITAQVIAGPPDTCDIQHNDAPTAALVYTPTGGGRVYSVLATGADAKAVSGIGDGAFYSDETKLLVVSKGDAMLSIAVYDVDLTEAQQQAIEREIGKVAAGRM
jgi:hypothetical protein